MTVNELITVLKSLQNDGQGDYDVFAVSAHDMIEPDGEITVKRCEHEIYIRGDLLSILPYDENTTAIVI